MAEKKETISNDKNFDVIKGDTIGNTAYSERFVLNVLIKILNLENLKNEQLEEYIETELCVLWDMTTESDVCEFLLRQNSIEIYYDVLKMNYSPRITEVIIGTMANMCSSRGAIQEVREKESIRKCIFDYISCDDSLIIIQVLRLIFALMYYDSPHQDMWFEFLIESEFPDKAMFLLKNSMNEGVLSNTFETINCICSHATSASNKAYIVTLFVNSEFIKSTLVGFEELSNKLHEEGLEETYERCGIVFLSMHSILSNFDRQSSLAYKKCLPGVLQIARNILCKNIGIDNNSIVDIIEYITASLPVLYDPNLEESKDITCNMLKLWKKITHPKAKDSENSDKIGSSNDKDLEEILPQYFVRVFEPLTEEQLLFNLRDLDKEQMFFLSKKIKEMISDSHTIPPYFISLSIKMQNILQNI